MLDFYTEKKIHKRVLHFHSYEIVNNQYMHIEVLPLSKYQNRTGKKITPKKNNRSCYNEHCCKTQRNPFLLPVLHVVYTGCDKNQQIKNEIVLKLLNMTFFTINYQLIK